MKFNEKNAGFSLVELMVVVVILGILSAYAVLNYQSHVLKTKRVECQAVMTSVAAELERRFARNNQYSDTPALTGAGAPFNCAEYDLEVDISNSGSSFLITATPTTPSQTGEVCTQIDGNLTLDERNTRTPDSSGCW